MKLIFDNIVGLGDNGLGADELRGEGEKIPGFLEGIKKRGQGFTELPRQKASVLAVKHLAEKLKGKFDDVVVLGIGGSALGITCLRDALKGPFWNMNKKAGQAGGMRLFVLDNLDLVEEVEKAVDVDRTLFVVISKSGGTIETMSMYQYFRKKVSKENFVFITGEKGALREMGEELKVPILDIPENVGGRFSVLSTVGLFPAEMLGIDIEMLLEGAEDMLDVFYETEFDMNLPFQIATVQYLMEWKHGVPMTVMMPYSTRLWTFADWYRQLLAESIGKDGKGITPVRALGVTDQHSQLQLYNEGPTDKLIFFIEVEKLGIHFETLMDAEKEATEKALKQYKKPNLTLRIDEIDARNLGRLFMLFECSVAFLGEYYRINAFDQPGVELGKKLTKEILSKLK
jgi:glucose-6-phosphate isomerase